MSDCFVTLQRRGRGALSNSSGRFEARSTHCEDDGWQGLEQQLLDERSGTLWRHDRARSAITRNDSPDLHFSHSVNPYRGCEHGCIYCFARPSHAFLGHSPGLDFERLLYAKADIARLLEAELAHPEYRCEPIAVGVNTDAWQPLERRLRLTRGVLQVLHSAAHPAYLITKASLIERDIDLIAAMAERQLVSVSITITTLESELARRLEPRATAPHRRLRTIERLASAGIPVRVSVSPIIPALNEHEIDAIVVAAANAGAIAGSAILLRLPHELGVLFEQWLEAHYPDRKARVLKAIRSVRGGRLNDSSFDQRMLGQGPRAALVQQRFTLACRGAGIEAGRQPIRLDTAVFRPPSPGGQMALFD